MNTQLAVEFGIRTELNPALMKHHDFAPYMEHLAKMHPLYFVRTLDSLKDHPPGIISLTSTYQRW